MNSGTASSAILLVDDDHRLCRFLSRFLTGEGFAIEATHDGRGMRRALADATFDLVLLDLTFPHGEDGLSLARALKAQSPVPLIMLTGKGTTIDKVVGLELGADDYVTKPFEPRELLARIRSVLRRAASQPLPREAAAPAGRLLSFHGWRLDLSGHELYASDGGCVALTSHEFRLLATLAQRPGRILSREQILELAANRHWQPYDRSIDVMIAKLRRKLDDDPRHPRIIKTIRGIGYMLSPT